MGFNWNTWKEWSTPSGLTVRVITALSIGAALLWYKLSDPRYPTTYDTAEVMAAIIERSIALIERGDSYSSIEQTIFPETNSLGNIVYVEQTNAVGIYPSRSLFLTKIPGAIAAMPPPDDSLSGEVQVPRFVDLWRDSEGASGVAVINNAPYLDGDTALYGNGRTPFSNEWVQLSLGWWTNYVKRTAASVGQFNYQDAAPAYMSTGILTQIARPLSAMRWAGTTGWPVEYDTNGVYVSHVRWEGTSTWYAVSTAWSDMLAAALSDLAASPMYGENTNGWDKVRLAGHFMYALCQKKGSARRAYVQERAYITGTSEDSLWEFRPALSNLVRSVYDCGVFATNEENHVATPISGVFSPDGEPIFYRPRYFAHGAGASPHVWEAMTVNEEQVEGVAAYRSRIHSWEGRLDTAALGVAGQTNVIVGWVSSPRVFLVDFAFEHLTNAPAFWGTSYGIR